MLTTAHVFVQPCYCLQHLHISYCKALRILLPPATLLTMDTCIVFRVAFEDSLGEQGQRLCVRLSSREGFWHRPPGFLHCRVRHWQHCIVSTANAVNMAQQDNNDSSETSSAVPSADNPPVQEPAQPPASTQKPKKQYRQVQMPTAEQMVQEDMMNNCAVRTVMSGVLGSGLGLVFGVVMGSMDAGVGFWQWLNHTCLSQQQGPYFCLV